MRAISDCLRGTWVSVLSEPRQTLGAKSRLYLPALASSPAASVAADVDAEVP